MHGSNVRARGWTVIPDPYNGFEREVAESRFFASLPLAEEKAEFVLIALKAPDSYESPEAISAPSP